MRWTMTSNVLQRKDRDGHVKNCGEIGLNCRETDACSARGVGRDTTMGSRVRLGRQNEMKPNVIVSCIARGLVHILSRRARSEAVFTLSDTGSMDSP